VSFHRHGLVIGKFYPPHAGHHALIRAAAAGCEQVTVLAMAAKQESVPLDSRVRWLRETHAGERNVTVVGIPCDAPMDLGDPSVWAAQVALMRAALEHHRRGAVDALYSSEPYGDELARRLDAEHVCVDLARQGVPISAGRIRADLAAHWDLLAPATRAGLAARVVLLGSESTGTTTVSQRLVERYRARGGVWARTGWVAEYGRAYTATRLEAARAQARAAGQPEPRLEDLVWDASDFDQIAHAQTSLEQQAAREGSPLLVCDTDAFATHVWERRYLEGRARPPQAWARELPPRDVYLLTSHEGVPFVQDGLRDGEHIRAQMTGWFIEALTAAGHSWVLLTGTVDQRVQLAERCCEIALANRARFTEPLG